MGLKLTPADIVFSQCVRAASDHVCLKCEIRKPPTNKRGSSGMDCSHVFSRRHRTIRWCKDNAKSLCTGCHRWWHENPAESGKWFESIVGEAFIDRLIEKREQMLKVPKSEEKEIAKHYRKELESLEDKRLNGAVGYIDFVSWQ